MAHSTNQQDHNKEEKDNRDAAVSQQDKKDESHNTVQPDSPKIKSYADIIRGFEEIDKIFKRQNEKGK